MKIKIGWLFVTVLMLTSCGGIRSVRTAKTTAKADGASLMKETLLSAEQQRKYDYFFLEAMRMKGKNEYDAAFGLLQHCLDINPTASSALYEISQYYMFLRQVPQGQVALEQAVAFAPDNYWYSQGLVSLYQQQNELDKAAKVLPEQWKDKDGINHVGRITKGAAYGLKARAALYAKRWQDAVDACDEVFKLEKKGVHALLGKNQYNDIFTVPNNKELLLTVNYEKMKLQHSFNLNCCPPYDYKEAGALKDFCGAAMTPTEEYASQFDIKVNGNWQSFTWDNLSQYANGPWTDRDPRFYASILYNGASWIKDRKLQVYVGGHDGIFEFKNDPADDYKRSTTTGYYIRKFIKNDAEINFVDVQSDQFWIEMRMAEVYLIRSEAYARLEKWSEAYIDLNAIRGRVGMPALPQQNVWDSYLTDLEKERICELGMEGHRFFDLVRWGKAVETLNEKRLHGVKITKLPTGAFEYKVVECDTEDRLFPKQYTISPIPTAELVANTLCEQSDLWK